jgi:hypothetical protein
MRMAQGIVVCQRERRRIVRRCAWLPLIVLMAAILCGCGRQMVSVHGSVAREGGPLPGGKVIFTPIGDGQPAVGLIQHDGTFQLSTNRENDGAMTGRYRISVLGDRPPEDGTPRMIYSSPDDLTVEIAAGQTEEIAINIRMADGWQAIGSD